MSFSDRDYFTIIQLAKKDVTLFKEMLEIFNEVFEEPERNVLSEFYLQELLEREDFIALAVISQGKVIGGLTGYELKKYYVSESEFFIYDLAVKKQFQRKGLGERLIENLREICLRREIVTFFVDAHRTDTHALEFYRAIGGKPEEVVQFTFS